MDAEKNRASLDDDLNTASLPTITEEDGESIRSGSTTSSNKNSTGSAMASASPSTAVTANEAEADGGGKKDKEKKKKKKGKHKDAVSGGSAFYSAEDHDTAQQILVDLCSEMKDLKSSMQEGQEKASENLDSNEQLMRRLADQMEMLQAAPLQHSFIFIKHTYIIQP